MNADELRAKFIKENAEFLLDEYSTVLRGKGDFSCDQIIHLSNALDLLREMISKAADTSVVEANNAGEVIKAVTKGKITPAEAERLLTLLKTQQDIEELPQLQKKLDELLFNKGTVIHK